MTAKSPLARSVSAASPGRTNGDNPHTSVFAAIEKGSWATLLFAVRKRTVHAEALMYAHEKLGSARLAAALSLHISGYNTTLVHEIFRHGSQRLITCIIIKMPHLVATVEPQTGDTPLHLIAQRQADGIELNSDFVQSLFHSCDAADLLRQAADGKTAVHYLGAFGHDAAYAAVEKKFPRACTVVARDGSTPASLFSARLRRDLECERIANQRLLQAAGEQETVRAANSKFEQLQADIGRREQTIKAQETQIKKLTEERSALQEREEKMQRDSAQQQSELEKLRNECRRSQSEAARARENLNERVSELENAQEQCSTLQYEMAALREQVGTNATDLEKIDSDKSQLESELALLRSERDSVVAQLSAAGADGDKMAQHNRELAHSISNLEGQIDTLLSRVDASEREKARMNLEKDRLEDVRATIARSLQQNELAKESLQTTVDLAEQRAGELESQMEAVHRRFRHSERELEQLRRDMAGAREQQKAIETSCERQLDALQKEREALLAQLADARTTARQADEKARQDVENLRSEMRALAETSTAAQERAKRLQHDVDNTKREAAASITRMREETEQQIQELTEETQRQKAIAEEALTRARSSTERTALTEHSAKLVADAKRVEAELNARLKEAQESAAAQIAERSALLQASEQQLAELRSQLDENNAKSASLESAVHNTASEWTRYAGEVQERHEASEKDLREKLQKAEDQLRHARKELEQERAIAATRDSIDSKTPRARPTAPLNGSGKHASLRRARTLRVLDGDKPAPPPQAPMDEQTQLMLRNHEINNNFYARVFALVREGNYKVLTELFNAGLNPNTRCAEEGSFGQTMLEVAVRTISKRELSLSEATIDQITKTVPLLVQRGGDWEDLDEFLRTDSHTLPDKFLHVLRKRDDASPFCKSLIEGRASDAEKHLDTVENLNRVPSRYEQEGYTYLHVAVLHQAARLIQAMLLTGRVSVEARDNNDRTSLHLLLETCNDAATRLTIAQYLLAAGASAQEPCRFEKIIAHSRSKLESFATEPTAAPKKARGIKSLLKRGKDSAGKSLVHDLGKLQTEARRFGTPLVMAQALGDSALVACMKNRRYLLPTIDTAVSEDTGRPLLQTYITNAVLTQIVMEELIVSGQVAEDDELYRIFQRYRNVFFAFNPNFGGRDGYAGVLRAIGAAAGASRCSPEQAQQLIVSMVLQDELALAKLMQQGKQSDSDDDERLRANASPIWEICALLKQATAGVADGWFAVSAMIEMPTRELYDDAVLLALRFFIKQNHTQALEYMLNRRDRLFGDVDINTVIDEKLQYTGIEYAAHLGVTETLEWFMERQRTRIDQPGAFGRTLVSIASAAGQPISIVAIDKFKFDNKISLEQHTNSAHYGIETPDLQNTVLHQCARQHRIDLLRYCIDLVVHQIRKVNRSGQTPLTVAEQSHSFHGAFKNAAQERAAVECIEFLEQKMDRGSSSGSNTPHRVKTDNPMPPPPALRLPPPVGAAPTPPVKAKAKPADPDFIDEYDFDLSDDDEEATAESAPEKKPRRKKSKSSKK